MPPTRETPPRRSAAELCALLTGVVALAIAAAGPLGWAYHATGDEISLMSAGREPGGRTDGTIGVACSREGLSEPALVGARTALAAAERAVEREREHLAMAQRAADEARSALLAERSARQAADQAVEAAREELGRERSAREAADLATKEALARKPKAWRLKRVESRWAW